MTGYTTPDALPYPSDYNQPADSPNAFQALAAATQAALDSKPDTTQTEAAYVKGPEGVYTANWDHAILAGFYYSAPETLNNPSEVLGPVNWFGIVAHLPGPTIHQIAWPLGVYPKNATMQRSYAAGPGWSPWSRFNNYNHAWGALDNLTTLQHLEVTRFAHGYVKDPASTAPTGLDEWRVQCYNTAGVFTWSAIKIPESGIVSMPRGHALLLERLAAGQPLQADQVITVGALGKLLARILDPDDELTADTITDGGV